MANNIIKRVWNQNRIVHIDDLRGMLFQAESGGHTFQISGVDDEGNTVALSGTVTGVFLRPDNTDVAITGSASGGAVSVTLPAECYSVPGRFGLTVFVTDSGQKTAVYAAIGTVSRTSSGAVAPGATADVVDLINQINAAVATIPASWTGLMADIAPTYSDAAVYPVGSYVYYNGDLYRCTTAITTAESWTAGHWTAAVLGNDVTDLKSALNATSDTLGEAFTWSPGYYGIGNGEWTSQTEPATYHSTEKFTGKIPDSDQIMNIDLMTSDSFFPVWNGSSYVGYLMDGVWKRPSGNAYATPPSYTQYAIVVHNVANYDMIRMRLFATAEENAETEEIADIAKTKADIFATTITINNGTANFVQNSNPYGYKVSKDIWLESVTPNANEGYCAVYIMRLQSDGSYISQKAKNVYPGQTYEVKEWMNAGDAVLMNYLGASTNKQYYATSDAGNFFSTRWGWNSSSGKFVQNTDGYYIPGTYVCYDPQYATKTEFAEVKENIDVAKPKADMFAKTVTVRNEGDQSVTNSNFYGYKVKRKMWLKSFTPDVTSGYCKVYLQRLQADGTYTTEKSKSVYPGDSFDIETILDVDDALLLNYLGASPNVQYFARGDNGNFFSTRWGWNSSSGKFVQNTDGYYIPGTYVCYDPVTNDLLNYIDDGNPCNWKGTECSVFDNILCIGDSITQGAPTPPDITPDPTKATRTVNNKEMYSYPASMKKQWGVTCTNWGISGITSQGWYDRFAVSDPSWSGHDAAIMLIGNNDYHLVDDLGGLTTETLPIASQRSKAAMMSIITKLKADNADIKIFICTLLPGWATANSLNPYICENVRDIAETEDDVFLIDMANYSSYRYALPYSNVHPTAIGYNLMAREIGGAIGYTIVKNPDEFAWIQFIGTEYAMDGQ